MNRSTTSRWIISAALVTAFCLSGCSAPQPTQQPEAVRYELPGLIQYNYRWSAEPGIDLFGSPEIAVRAYLESYYIASFAHSTAAGYPGFEKATQVLVYDPPRERDINDRTNFEDLPHTGTFYAHILSVERSDQSFRAVVCQGNYSLMTAVPEGGYVNFGSRIPSPAVVELAPGPNGTTQDTRAAEGPARAPQTDMFGGWTVTRHALSTKNFDDNLTCVDKFPDPPETRPQRRYETFSAPYQTLPPYPGWSSSQ